MTRPASDLSWDGDKSPHLPEKLTLYGREFTLKKLETGTIGVRGPDLHLIGRALPSLLTEKDASENWKRSHGEELFRSAPEVDRELVLITGSHHYLAFWLEGGADAELRQLPFVYLLESKRWLPREEVFLQPPTALPQVARWNANCIQCHAVAGQPGQTEGHEATGAFWQRYETRVADLGISCEACHGPGSKHTEYYRNPLKRISAEAGGSAQAQHVFNPKAARADVGASACGQCHSYFVPKNPENWWETGFTRNFQAGETLTSSRKVVNAEDFDQEHSGISGTLAAARESLFWDDGSMMIGGREYNGLIKSPCYEHAPESQKMTCTSCHSMHNSDPNHQIADEYASAETMNRMCSQCHEEINESHSRHKAGSEGARCVACHMPRTSYALLKATRSHRITSPTATQTSPPSACVLCHVSETKLWFEAQLAVFSELADTWPQPTPGPSLEQNMPWAVELAMTHNAATRAIFADNLGQESTWRASGTAVSEKVLPFLQNDDYAAVRQIADRSQSRVLDYIRRNDRSTSSPKRNASTNTPLTDENLFELLGRQDSTPIVISE